MARARPAHIDLVEEELAEAVEAEIVELDDGPTSCASDARAIRAACEALTRYVAPYVERTRTDAPADDAARLALARELVDEALQLLA
jgi:hypothetical protein